MRFQLLAVVAAAFSISGAAQAGVFTFSYSSTSGPLEDASGTFTTSATGLVTGITGTVTTSNGATSAITGLSSYASANNIYSPGVPNFNFSGLSFADAAGVSVNLYSYGPYLATDTLFDASGSTPVTGDALVGLAVTPQAGGFSFSYSSTVGPVEDASGSFTTSATGLVTSITGTVTTSNGATSAITGLSSYASADNIYSASGLHFDFSGLSFSDAAGVDVNLYSDTPYLVTDTLFDASGSTPVSSDAVVNLVITAVPEPATWAMLVLGLGGVGAALRRRRAGGLVAA